MTHVNAFHAEVEAKEKALAAAQSELNVAKEALLAHPDYVKPKAEKPAASAPKAKKSK